jgi:hypothetical protein
MGKRDWKMERLGPRALLWPLFLSLFMAMTSCGTDDDTVAEAAVPRDFCAVPENRPSEEEMVGAIGLRTAEHGGSSSDLNLDWTEDTVTRRLCPGQHTINLAIRNDSGHTVGRNVWFTILYYYGNEYVRAHRISSQGIDVAVGETVPVSFTVDLKAEFASAGDRNVRIAVIVQTDNPNPNDPVAFFRRVWVNLLPASGCGQEPLSQPARDPLMIYSVTCEGRNIRLQTAPRLIDGNPSARVVDGQEYVSLTRDAYFEDDLWWADLRVDRNIPRGDQSMVSFGSNARDTMYFVLGPRVECGGDGSAIMTGPQGRRADSGGGLPPGEDPANDGDDGDGTGNGTGNDTPQEDPVPDPVDGDPIGDTEDEAAPDETEDVPEDVPGIDEGLWGDVEFEGTAWALLHPCGAPLEGTRVPPEMGNGEGLVVLGDVTAAETELTVLALGLPVQAENRVYQVWMASEVGENRWRFLPVETFRVDEPEALITLTATLNPLAVLGADGGPGREILVGPGGPVGTGLGETGGVSEALPLARFTHFFVTLEDAQQPQGELAIIPSAVMALSGSVRLPEELAQPR